MPSVLDDLGLLPALERLVADVREHHPIDLTLELALWPASGCPTRSRQLCSGSPRRRSPTRSGTRAGLRALFDRQPDMEVVAEAGSAAEALDRAAAVAPELIVLDLTLPGGGGMSLIGTLLDRDPSPGWWC
jgi:CheY-like chemotaxis protein